MSSVEPLSSVWIPRADWEGLSRWVVRMEQFYDTLRTPATQTWATFVEEGVQALRRWAQQGTFRELHGPGVAVVRQRFEERGVHRERWGVWSLYRWEDNAAPVFEHEHTFPEGVAAYVETYRRLGVFPDPVHLLTPASFETWKPLLDHLKRSAPVLDVQDAYGDTFTLWWVDDPATVRSWVQRVSPPFVIADGHHRMAAARTLATRGQLKARPVVITALDDPGLVIRPFHRVFRGDPALPVPEPLRRLFRWEPLEEGDAIPAPGSLLWVTPEAWYRVRPMDETLLLQHWDEAVPPAYARLETAWLHEVILPAFQKAGHPLEVVQYVERAGEALQAVQKGRATLSVLLPPPTPEQVFAIARAGRILPQKSTAFYPKLLAGVVTVPLQPDPADQTAALR